MLTKALSAVLLAYLAFPTAAGAQEGAPREHRLTSEVAIDCNNNGLADADDIRAGLDTDDDGDGIPDHCNHLIEWPWSVKHRSLGPEARTDEDKYFRLAYLPTQVIEITYAVPKPENVELIVVTGPGEIRVLSAGMKEPGAYKVDYSPTDTGGAPKKKGLEFIRVVLGNVSYSRPVAWSWR